MSTTEIPDGYEPAEVSAAKDHVHEELDSYLDQAGIDPDEAGIDLIRVADRIVSRLIASGVVIPEEIRSPYRCAH